MENVRLIATLEQKVNARTAELRQAAREAQLARELAEKANQAKSIFLANMSHEFRTPLNAILGFAQILAHTIQTPKEQEYLDALLRSGRHLLTLINEVLDFAKIESGHITLQQDEVDLVSLLNEVHDLFNLKAQEKRIQLVITRAPDVPWMICTDEVKLRQILINLIGNAVKFTETGSVTVRVWTPPTLSGETGAGSLRIIFEIEDTGPGIAPDELTTLFTAFTQTRTGQQAKEGTGLGLTISQQFVHLLGGDLRVNSVVGQGTTFSFAVRAGVMASDGRTTALSPRQAVALAPEQPVYRLLIADDQPDNRQVLMALLQPFGFAVREAYNGQEAFELWQQWQPHLIWMDLRMPKMDGYAAAQAIRSAEAQKAEGGTLHTIIIALSASVFEEEQAVALESGCDDFLRKPFREHEIFNLLEKHLQIRFIYADAAAQPAALDPCQLPSAALVTAANLAALPDDLRQRLRTAIESLDMDMVLRMIAGIRQQNAPLAEAIAELVKQYRFDLIQQCFEDTP